MARKKTVRNLQVILEELYGCINFKLKELLNYNQQLADKTLPRERVLELSVKMFELWIELEPMHQTIRVNNPKAELFFNSLDHEVATYKKSAVNQIHLEEEKTEEPTTEPVAND